MFWTPYDLLLIPGLLMALWAQYKVKHAYAKFSEIGTRRGLTGAEVAARILRDYQIEPASNVDSFAPGEACGIEAIPGAMTDHYDPQSRTLRLSQDVYHGQSIAALGIAAHEVGHAIQHAQRYSPLMMRSAVYPVCSIGSTLSIPLFFIGLIASIKVLTTLGILLFSASVFFTLVTLPVEFDASRRAMRALASGGYLSDDELYGAKKVLQAAALTYVAAAASAILNLLRLILISRGRDD